MNTTETILGQSRCIAHEIRNYLSICELYTQIIRKNLGLEGVENESIDNALDCITKSVKIMNNCLLDLKSLNNIDMAEYDLKSTIEKGIELAKAYIHRKNITISTSIKDTGIVCIDENKFLACIVNIIKNAIEAISESGKINISLEIENNIASIKISNNGYPISKDEQETIFNQGFTTKPTGSGLGLHICANNLKAQNAILRLNKSTEEITEFEINLPVVA